MRERESERVTNEINDGDMTCLREITIKFSKRNPKTRLKKKDEKRERGRK